MKRGFFFSSLAAVPALMAAVPVSSNRSDSIIISGGDKSTPLTNSLTKKVPKNQKVALRNMMLDPSVATVIITEHEA